MSLVVNLMVPNPNKLCYLGTCNGGSTGKKSAVRNVINLLKRISTTHVGPKFKSLCPNQCQNRRNTKE